MKEIRNFDQSIQDRVDELKKRGDYDGWCIDKRWDKIYDCPAFENASEAAKESRADKSDMLAAGRRLAYYEMLDVLRTELDVRGQDLKEFGIDINLENQIA